MANRSRGQRPLDDLKIVNLPISSLKPNPRNARTHTRRQIRKIADSIRAFGFNNPVLVDKNNLIVAGHGRAKAAKLLGMTEVPTVRLSHMTEAEMRGYVIADNRLAEKAGWDDEILAIEFQTLFEIAPELDLTITGFEIAEIDAIIQAHDDEVESDALDNVAPPDPGAPVVTRRGDLWQLDRHRVLCADATRSEPYDRLLEGQRAQMVFTDPPYNLPIRGHVSGLGRVQHNEFAMASGEMSEAEFTAFLTISLNHIRAHSADGAIAYVCMDWRHYLNCSWQAARRSSRSRICACGSKPTPAWALLPLAARTYRRLQGRNGTAYQQLRARAARTLSHQRLDLSRRQQLRRRTRRGARHASDRQAGGAGRRCHQRLLEAQRPHP